MEAVQEGKQLKFQLLASRVAATERAAKDYLIKHEAAMKLRVKSVAAGESLAAVTLQLQGSVNDTSNATRDNATSEHAPLAAEASELQQKKIQQNEEYRESQAEAIATKQADLTEDANYKKFWQIAYPIPIDHNPPDPAEDNAFDNDMNTEDQIKQHGAITQNNLRQEALEAYRAKKYKTTEVTFGANETLSPEEYVVSERHIKQYQAQYDNDNGMPVTVAIPKDETVIYQHEPGADVVKVPAPAGVAMDNGAAPQYPVSSEDPTPQQYSSTSNDHTGSYEHTMEHPSSAPLKEVQALSEREERDSDEDFDNVELE